MEQRVYRLSVVADTLERARELTRQLAGAFELDLQPIQAALRSNPKGRILIDIDLENHRHLPLLRDWLGRKTADVTVIFVVENASRRQEARAFALGATAVVHRPVSPQALFTKFQDDDATLASLASASNGVLTPGIAVAVDSLQDIFAAASTGSAVEADAMQTTSSAIVDQLEAQGLSSWVETVRTHHSQTYQHCLLVTGVAAAFGEHIGLSRKDRQRLSVAGMLHDIGKARIPLAILEKPGRLDEAEMAEMRKHPEYGLEALGEGRGFPAEMLDIVVHHHELLDGSGYPHGLQGQEISDLARIMTISDIFGALIERRSYKPPLSSEAAYQILLDMGPKLDKDLVRAFKFVSRMDQSVAA